MQNFDARCVVLYSKLAATLREYFICTLYACYGQAMNYLFSPELAEHKPTSLTILKNPCYNQNDMLQSFFFLKEEDETKSYLRNQGRYARIYEDSD